MIGAERSLKGIVARGTSSCAFLRWTSILIFILLAVCWAISTRWIVGYGDWSVWSSIGYGDITVAWRPPYSGPGPGFGAWIYPIEAYVGWTERFGSARPALDRNALEAPIWLWMTIFGAAAWRFRARPIPEGRCSACGYDLTGNVSGRCPECGRTNIR